ncbi:hypothetical protein EON66_03015 [archaeon]|nr:MAG: hypothetical protein EON66_03015 [archaeon]
MDVAGEGVSYKALVARFRTAPPAPRGERASVAARQSGLTSSTVSHASRGEGGELPAWLSSIVASTASVGSDASRTERDNASVRLSSTAAQPTPAPVAPTIAALDATADRSMPSSSGAYVPPARPALRWAAVTPAEQAPPTPTPYVSCALTSSFCASSRYHCTHARAQARAIAVTSRLTASRLRRCAWCALYVQRSDNWQHI